MARWANLLTFWGLVTVICLLVTVETSSSESWDDDGMHESSDDTPRPSMSSRGSRRDGMHGRDGMHHGDDGMHRSDDGMHHGDDGMHRSDRGMHGRDDRMHGRRGSSPDYTPWWIRRRSSRPFHPGMSSRPFHPFFPRSWGSYPSMRRSSSFPWGMGSWGSRRSPFFPHHSDSSREGGYSSLLSLRAPESLDDQGRRDSLLNSRSDSSSWGRGWSDRTWGIPSWRDSWGMDWSSRDRSWNRPFWWDDSNFWRVGTPGWRRSSGWRDDDSWSRSRSLFFPWRSSRDPWSSGGRSWNRWDDDFDGFSSRENDGDSDDWWSRSRSRGWVRPSPWGRSWGSSYQHYDDSVEDRNAFYDPFSWLFGPQLVSGPGVSPLTAPTVTPVTPGPSLSSSESPSKDDPK